MSLILLLALLVGGCTSVEVSRTCPDGTERHMKVKWTATEYSMLKHFLKCEDTQ